MTQQTSPEGPVVRGAPQDEHTFVGVMHASQLFAFAPDPMKLESVSRGRMHEPELQELSPVRVDVQRMFEGAKRRNVPSYADYIKRLYRGQIEGATPIIELWCQEPLPDGNGLHEKIIPWGTKFIAIDGETQLAARYVASAEEPLLKRASVSVRIHHGRPVEWARQAFHDFNTLAVKPNTTISISMDQRNPLTKLAQQLEAEVPELTGRVHRTARQLGTSDQQLVTLATLRIAVIGFIAGSAGIQSSFRLGDWSEMPANAAERATQWFRALFGRFSENFEPQNRKSSVMPGPATMAALGIIGHMLLVPPLDTMDDERVGEWVGRTIDALGTIDWDRGSHWGGIAGTLTPSGAFSTAGGVKEHTYAILKALDDEESPEYYQLRKQTLPARVAASLARPAEQPQREAHRRAA